MKKRGFTLIEMLIVIVIIGILAGALIPRIGSARDKANDTAREANVRSLATAMVSYGMDHGYPKTTDTDIAAGSGTLIAVKRDNTTGSVTVYDLSNLDLSAYAIPSKNFNEQPTDKDHYYYNKLTDGDHFVIYALLSAGTGAEGGNCNFHEVASGITYDVMNKSTTGDAFCYFQ